MEKYKEIERSIIKKYRKERWSKFIAAVKDYELINENDKIMVCISGGKDSFLLAKCIQELERHSNIFFNAYYVVMNPGYNEKNLELIKENAKTLNVPIEIFESDIFAAVDNIDMKSPCYMCARMRRGYLYNKAKKTPVEERNAELKAMIETYNKEVDFVNFSELDKIIEALSK